MPSKQIHLKLVLSGSSFLNGFFTYAMQTGTERYKKEDEIIQMALCLRGLFLRDTTLPPGNGF
jgi:hypothetical protein